MHESGLVRQSVNGRERYNPRTTRWVPPLLPWRARDAPLVDVDAAQELGGRERSWCNDSAAADSRPNSWRSVTDTITDVSAWARVGAINPRALTDARLQLHHAAQLIVSAAISYLPARDDDSHTSMEWLPEQAVLAIAPFVPDGTRVGLRVRDLTLLSIDRDRAIQSSLALDGRTNAEGLAWLSAEVRRAGCDLARLTTRKHYTIPPHEVARGAAYRASPEHVELARYYHNGWLVASRVTPGDATASPVRCWPHHFDIATLLSLPPVSGIPARTIGVGLSPGDESYPEPYFYVAPYPRPPHRHFAPLPYGGWHTAEWVGAALTATELAGQSKPHDQQAVVSAFVTEAVDACRRVLDGIAPD